MFETRDISLVKFLLSQNENFLLKKKIDLQEVATIRCISCTEMLKPSRKRKNMRKDADAHHGS